MKSTPAMRKHRLADVPPGAEDPISAAVRGRDQGTLNMVANAVRHDQTLLAFQPIIVAQQPDRVGCYEGLIRVLDDTGRIIPAAEFMPAVERTELGREIDVCALRMGLRTLHRCPDLRLAINMSARSIGYGGWMRTLTRWIDKDPTIAERLILEITESSAMEQPELVLDFMDRLALKGISFALDDFGAGHTALRYFRDFHFDILKIDGSFCKGIADDADNQALVRAMILIGRHFEMLIIAEAVERQNDMDMLVRLGVDCLQGYYLAAPTTRPAWLFGHADPMQRSSAA